MCTVFPDIHNNSASLYKKDELYFSMYLQAFVHNRQEESSFLESEYPDLCFYHASIHLPEFPYRIQDDLS